MTAFSRASLAVGLAIVLGGTSVSVQTPVRVPPDLAAEVQSRGVALVIVGVDAPFAPEGSHLTRGAVLAQRSALQAAVNDTSARAEAGGAVVVHRFETIPFFSARVDAGALDALSRTSGVRSVQLDRPRPARLGQSVPLVNAPAAWTAGFTGQGWSVAVLDTGVDTTHPFLAGRVVAEACYSNGGGGAGGTSLCPGGVPASTAAGSGRECAGIDGCDHGTHVAGIAVGAAGQGGINGVAPGAGLIAMQVFTRSDDPTGCDGSAPCITSTTTDILLGLERVLVLAGPGNMNRVAAVNLSLGAGGPDATNCDATAVAEKAAIDNLASVGIATIAASGNSGFTNGIGGSPGASPPRWPWVPRRRPIRWRRSRIASPA